MPVIGYRPRDWKSLVELYQGQQQTEPVNTNPEFDWGQYFTQPQSQPRVQEPDLSGLVQSQLPWVTQEQTFPEYMKGLPSRARESFLATSRWGADGSLKKQVELQNKAPLWQQLLSQATATPVETPQGTMYALASAGVPISPKGGLPKNGKIIPKGGIVPPTVSGDPLFNEALDIIKTKVLPAQKTARQATKQLYAEARAPAFEKVGEILQTGKGEAMLKQASSELALGRLPRAEFQNVENLMTQAHKDAVINNLATNPNLVKASDKFSASIAMKRIFSPLQYVIDHPKIAEAVPPNTPFRNYELRLFEQAWGKKTADEIANAASGMASKPLDEATMNYLRSLPDIGKELPMFANTPRDKVLKIVKSVGSDALDALGTIKSLKFGFDLSYPFRQGAIIGARHPVAWLKSWKPMLQAMKSEQIAIKLNRELLTDPEIVNVIDKMGLDLYGVEKGLSWFKRPESVASLWAEKYVPGVRMSERAAGTFMNKLMSDVGKTSYRAMTGMKASEGEYKAMGSLINQLGGRGTLPKQLQGTAGDILNKIFTSPRYVVSRFEWPTKLASESKAVRQEAASTIIAFTGMASAIVGLAYANGTKVEFDPRSSDAYKIRIGNKRIDIWVGYAQIMRFLAQMITGQRKTTTTGELEPMSRAQILGRFMESKEAPGMGALATLMSLQEGQVTTYVGQKLDLRTLAGWGNYAKETLSPAALQEVIDAYILEGSQSAGLSTLGLTGVGVSTYLPASDTTTSKVPSFGSFNTPQKSRTKKVPSFTR